MISLTEKQIKQIRKLRFEANSYKSISNIFNISKSTAYKYCKNVELNSEALNILNNNIVLNREKFVKTYGIPNKIKNTSLNIEKVRLISHCLFDGYVGKNTISYINKNHVLLDEFLGDVLVVYGLRGRVRSKKRNDVYSVDVYSVLAVEDLVKYIDNYKTHNQLRCLRIPKEIFDSKSFIKIFLRAFWDDEGTVGYYGYTRRLRAPCWNIYLRKDIIKLHNLLNIDAKEGENKYVVITQKSNFVKFKNLIGFTEGVKIGKKKFGKTVWESYDKLEVLSKMVDSYVN